MQMMFAVKNQANKITEGLRTFQKCLLKKKKRKRIFTSHEVMQSRYKYYFYVEFLDGGKWKNIFQSYFLEKWRS